MTLSFFYKTKSPILRSLRREFYNKKTRKILKLGTNFKKMHHENDPIFDLTN